MIEKKTKDIRSSALCLYNVHDLEKLKKFPRSTDDPSMDSLKIYVDRGSELNKKRIAGEYVDCFFIVEGQRFPAHKLIVALHSDYLKTLISWKTNIDIVNR